MEGGKPPKSSKSDHDLVLKLQQFWGSTKHETSGIWEQASSTKQQQTWQDFGDSMIIIPSGKLA